MAEAKNHLAGDEIMKNLLDIEIASAQLQQLNCQTIIQLRDLILGFQTNQLQLIHPNPLNKFGKKCFSQSDEDGITIEIVRRLGIANGVYAEFGVGNGLENNTLILAAMGWKGFWIGAEELIFNYAAAKNFKYIKDWITLDNVVLHAKSGLELLGESQLDIVSLDLDGNDIYFSEMLLQRNICPKLFIVEYNAKFIPPSKFQIKYDPNHRWVGDDYFGASLTNFVEMFEKYDYRLVCCNAHTGANAFFVKKEFSYLFNDVPEDIYDIYVGPRYYLYNNFGHKNSAKVVESIMNQQ